MVIRPYERSDPWKQSTYLAVAQSMGSGPHHARPFMIQAPSRPAFTSLQSSCLLVGAQWDCAGQGKDRRAEGTVERRGAPLVERQTSRAPLKPETDGFQIPCSIDPVRQSRPNQYPQHHQITPVRPPHFPYRTVSIAAKSACAALQEAKNLPW